MFRHNIAPFSNYTNGNKSQTVFTIAIPIRNPIKPIVKTIKGKIFDQGKIYAITCKKLTKTVIPETKSITMFTTVKGSKRILKAPCKTNKNKLIIY